MQRSLLQLICILLFTAGSSVMGQDQAALTAQQGAAAFADRQYADALVLYRRAAEAGLDYSQYALHALRFGMAAWHESHYAEAEQYLRIGGDAEPTLKPYADFTIIQSLSARLDHKATIAAAEKLQQANQISYLVRRSRLIRAQSHEALKQWAPAIMQRQAYLRGWTAPERAAIWYGMARDYLAAGNDAEALRWYRRIIDNQVLSGSALKASRDLVKWHDRKSKGLSGKDWRRHGEVLYRHRLYSEVRRWVDKYRRMYPTGMSSDFMTVLLGRSYYYSNQYRESIKTLVSVDRQKAEEDEAKNATLFTARSHLALDESDISIGIYQQFAKHWPSSSLVPEIWWKLGWIYEGRGEYDTARPFYEKNTTGRKNEFQERSAWRMGFCDFKAGRMETAITQFDRLLKPTTNDRVYRMALYWKGRALLALNQPERANKVFRLVTDYPMPDYYTFRAAARLQQVPFQPEITDSADVDNSTVPAFLQQSIAHAVTVGSIFNREFGETLLRQEETRAGKSVPKLRAVLRGYQTLGVSGRAMRLAIRTRDRHFPDVRLHRSFDIHQAIYPHHYTDIVEQHAGGLPAPGLVFAIMRRESAFDERAISHAGAMGLLQLLPTVAKKLALQQKMGELSYEDILRPENNIRLGTLMLKERMQNYSGFLPGVIASYNAGTPVVRRWMKRHGTDDEEIFIESLEYSETRNYVRGVLQDYWIYQRLY